MNSSVNLERRVVASAAAFPLRAEVAFLFLQDGTKPERQWRTICAPTLHQQND